VSGARSLDYGWLTLVLSPAFVMLNVPLAVDV
jgi:hypothetical protein